MSDELPDSLRERFGGALRSVAVGSLAADRLDLLYERPGASAREEVYQDLLLESLYCDGQERLYRAGDLRAVVRLFDDALVVTAFGAGGTDDAFVTLDADAGVDPTAVVEVCRECRPVEPGESG
jgi:hypothetical protein